MSDRTCTADGCEKPHLARGFCNSHYYHFRRSKSWTRVKSPPRYGCLVDGCREPHSARGYCRAHYGRWHWSGDPHGVPLVPDAERFWAKTLVVIDDCWYWLGSRNQFGYGSFRTHSTGRRAPRGSGERRNGTASAHRFAYELLVGPIPEAHDVDHLCFTRSCVNPAHLEPVTPYENRRRATVRREARKAARKRGEVI